MNQVYISLGSNLGNKSSNIHQAIHRISILEKTHIVKQSMLLKTEPLEVVNQPDFVNAVILVQTEYNPFELLKILQDIEHKMGRVFRYTKGPREIDLDILLFNDEVIHTETLVVPHHSVYTRPFVSQLLASLGYM
jgi:2-amino-4-hydroxy-6-hydroxymethyldihydropteridine diphosphokinase